MKVIHIVSSLEPRHGGPSVSVPALSAALARTGNDVELLSTGPAPASLPGGAHLAVRLFARGAPEFLGRSAGLAAHVAGSDADVLHSHGLWLRSLHYAHRRAASAGRIHVISPRGMMAPWTWNHHRWQKAAARRFVHPGALEGAHGWHATGPAEADEIRALGFRQPVCVAPNGVEAPTAASMEQARERWLELCPEARGRPTALFYSRLHAKKRVCELIDLWIAQAPDDWLLLVAGIPEGYAVRDLEDRVAAAGARGRVRIIDGTGLPPPYPVASLFLLPSHNENFGLVVAEALAHGVPALVTDTTPWQGLNAEGRGWCVPWDAYGEALRAALAEGADTLRRRGAASREWVLGTCSWDRSAAILAGFYGELLRNRS